MAVMPSTSAATAQDCGPSPQDALASTSPKDSKQLKPPVPVSKSCATTEPWKMWQNATWMESICHSSSNGSHLHWSQTPASSPDGATPIKWLRLVWGKSFANVSDPVGDNTDLLVAISGLAKMPHLPPGHPWSDSTLWWRKAHLMRVAIPRAPLVIQVIEGGTAIKSKSKSRSPITADQPLSMATLVRPLPWMNPWRRGTQGCHCSTQSLACGHAESATVPTRELLASSHAATRDTLSCSGSDRQWKTSPCGCRRN